MFSLKKSDQEMVKPNGGPVAEMVSIAPDTIQAANSTHFRSHYGVFGYFQMRAQFRAYMVRTVVRKFAIRKT